jgi:ABC-2 type transport system permease protein
MGNDVFIRQQASLSEFFGWAPIFLLFIVPALTMKQIAEEKRSGTIELLMTKNLSSRQLILGKFLACFLMVCITIAFTLPYYFTISQLGNADHGAIIGGYLGLLILSAAFTSIGIFASSLTQNQIVAFLLALVINVIFLWIMGFIGQYFSGFIGDLLNTLSIPEHYSSISRGVLDTKDLIYFGSLIFLFLFLAEMNVSTKN